MGIIFLLAVALQPANRREAILNWAVGTLLVGSAAAVFVLFPVLLLNGGWDETKSDIREAFKDDAKAAPAAVMPASRSSCPSPTRIEKQVILRGPGDWISTGVDLDQLPRGLNYRFYGPSGTVRFVDGAGNVLAEGPISQDFGVQGGIPEFSGETGRTATLCVSS